VVPDLDRRLFFNPASGSCLVTNAKGATLIEEYISGAGKSDPFIDKISETAILAGAADGTEYGRVPERLVLELTTACNLRCKTCYVAASKAGQREMTTREVERLLEETSRQGTETVAFLGGEPFLRSDLAHLVEYALGLFREVQVSTNGTLPAEEFFRRFSGTAGLTVQVSMDGPDADSNDAIRGKGIYAKASAFIDLARKHDIRTSLSGVLNRHNYNLVGKMCDFAFDKGCFLAIFHKVHLFGRAERFPEIIPRPGELKYGMNVLLNKFDRYERSGKMIVDFPHNRCFRGDRWLDARFPACHFGRAFAYVTSEGDLVCCSHLQQGEFNYGNVRDRSLIEIWQESPSLERMRRLTVDDIPSCSRCSFKYMCRGSCRADALGHSGELNGEPHDCEALRGFYSYVLDHFARNTPPMLPEGD
jgi:radical SAM protein with 4Fe4S-binding SPASM domain